MKPVCTSGMYSVPVNTFFFFEHACSLWRTILAKLLMLSVWSSSVLHAHDAVSGLGGLHVTRSDVAPLPAQERVLASRAAAGAAIALSRVVDHHHGGIHASQRVHAALARRVKPRGTQIQLVVARDLDEGAPAECSFEASSKPG